MTVSVLDHGYVKLIDRMGDDYRILQAARMSTGKPGKTEKEKDRKLLNYLYKNEHLTPFEMVIISLEVSMPIFVARQWMRHRTFSFNEKSLRYIESDTKYHSPSIWRKQSTSNKQMSSDEKFPPSQNTGYIDKYETEMKKIISIYERMIQEGVAREQARMILPTSVFTTVFMTVDLRNLFHFLELRLHEHAQEEIRVYAEAILSILEEIPGLSWSIEAFKKFSLD